MKLCSFLAIVIVFNFTLSAEECKNVTDKLELHLATKTPYRIVANLDSTKIEFAGCEPKKLWMLVRHGTRNPSSSMIENMKGRLLEIRDLILENNPEPTQRLRNSDLYALQKWKTKLESTEEKLLVHEGEDEMLELGERMQARFPSLLSSIYTNTSFYFKYTASQRTKASAKYFSTGLFGRRAIRDIWYPKASRKDPILRFYKLCSKWKNEVKNNPESLQEKRKFDGSSYALEAVKSMNKELKLKGEDRLSLEDIHLIYMTCSFETAWNRKRKSPWCSALTPPALKAMEFSQDLKYYYRDGYGYELTYKQACPAFNDMITYFESEPEFPKATVYFTHSGTLLKMLAHLGLYKDDHPLTQEDFENNDRQWRTSSIDAFGTNLAFVLHRCGENLKVAVLHQEHIVQLPNCEKLCDFEVLKQNYNESIQNCTFSEMCSIKNP